MNRNLKGTLLIVAIFACGVVVGGVAAKQFLGQGRPPGGPEGFGPSVMRRLTSELGLSEQQRAAIEPIIKKAGDELRVLRQESMKQSGGVIEAMNAAVTDSRAAFSALRYPASADNGHSCAFNRKYSSRFWPPVCCWW